MLKRLILVLLYLCVGAIVGALLGMVFNGDPAYMFVATTAFVIALGIASIGTLTLTRAKSSSVPVERPSSAHVPTIPIAAAVLIAVVGAAVTLIPSYGSIARAAESIAVGDWDGTNMVTGNYQQVAVDAIADVAGGYEFTSISFHDSFVIAVAPTYPGADTTDRYFWRYGHAFRDGPDFSQEEDLQSVLFDASGIDFSVVGQVTRQALADTAVGPIERVHLRVDGGGTPEIYLSLAGPYKDETFIFDPQGTLLETR